MSDNDIELLLRHIEDLEGEKNELENQIAELTQNQTGKRRSKGTGRFSETDELNALETENEDLQRKFEAAQVIISDLREQAASDSIKITSLTEEKQSLDKLLKSQNKRVEELEKDITEERNKSRTNELQSRKFNELKTANVKEANKLLADNQMLMEDNESLKQDLKQAEDEKVIYEELIAKLANEKDDIELKNENMDQDRYRFLEEKEQLENDLQEAQSLYENAMQNESLFEQKILELQKELKHLKEKSVTDSKSSSVEIADLKKQVVTLKDTTKVGEKQRALENLQNSTKDNTKLINELQVLLESANNERNILVERLLDLEDNIEQRVVDRISEERNKTKKLSQDLEVLKIQNQENVDHYQQIEQERNNLITDRDELTNWMAVYEAGHGMQEQSRVAKKLKEDKRRLEIAVQAYQSQVGALTDANGVLTQAFARLKKDAGYAPNFSYSEYELQNEVQSVNSSLQAQKNILEEQVAGLESENTRLRSAMKNQASSIGEQGFKYAGMNAEMLLQVNDFAANLRDKKVELPLNDRSRELLKENIKLKEQVDVFKLQLERYERELAGCVTMSPRGVSQAAIAAAGLSQGTIGMKDDVVRLAQENAAMHEKMNTLQSDLKKLLERPSLLEAVKDAPGTKATDGMISASELSSILTQNNQLMLRELESLKQTSQPSEGSFIRNLPYVASKNKAVSASINRATASYSAATPKEKGLSSSVTFTEMKTMPKSSFWTPGIAIGGMPFYGTSTAAITAGPVTPHGKQLLNSTLNQMNLPPEEWALDVRDLNSQLVECLEQLYEREQELEDQSAVVSTLEENLAAMKQQMTALYYDYAQRSESFEQSEQKYKKDLKELNEERDNLRMNNRRMQDMNELLQRGDKESIQFKLIELTRKVTIYEVNETMLTRKYNSQKEQLEQESSARLILEADFVEMETSLKKRILYLEQYKLAAGSRIGHLQVRVDSSIPQADYIALQNEIDVLREDHLNTLRREVEARMSSLKALDQAKELRAARIFIENLKNEFELCQSHMKSREAELIHQKEVTARALNAAKSSVEVSQLVSELARFRGEASRLEVELMASNRRADLLGDKILEVTREIEESEIRVKELEKREAELSSKESAARKSTLEMKLQYEGGLIRDKAEELKHKFQKCERNLEEALRDVARHRELSEIANQQAQSLSSFKKQNEDELKELREYCSRLESRSDDEFLIGRLQRQLMSTKTTYKAFVRKYHFARENMRKRELAMRILEGRLDEQDKFVINTQESYRLEVNALKKALYNLKNTVFESQELKNGEHKPTLNTGTIKNTKKKVKNLVRAGFAAITVGEKLVDVSLKVDALAVQAEDAVNRATQCENECREMKGKIEDLLAERSILEQRTHDLEALFKGKSKQQLIAARLIALSEDIRVSKISNLQQRRQIQVLREEKRHLHSVISNIEADVMELEEGKVDAETKHILYDIHEKTGLETDHDEFSSSLLNFSEINKNDKSNFVVNDASENIPQRIPTTFKSKESDTKLSLDIDNIMQTPGGRNSISLDELYQKLKSAHMSLADSRKEASDFKLKAGSYMNQIAELEALIQEKDGQIQYYERVLTEEGFPAVILRNPGYRDGHLPPVSANTTSRPYRMMHDEQEKLQEAASATIGSLRALLEEKNRVIERYREKLDRHQSTGNTKSRAERRADELLGRIAAEESEEARAKRYGASIYPDPFIVGVAENGSERAHRQQLLSQIEQADSIIAEKERLANQLEQKILSEINQRERAEVRCGESIKEMEAMKEDMITLVQQLQDSQARCAHLGKVSSSVMSNRTCTEPVILTTGDSNKLRDLENLVKTKDEKVKGYREIIIRLKEEFIKTEEEKAAAEVRLKAREAGEFNGPSTGGGGAINTEEMKALKNKLSDLHDGLAHAKDDLEKARKIRERLTLEKRQAEEALSKMQDETQKAELQMVSAQNGYHRVRKELETCRKNEVRLREKLKELLGGEGGTGNAKETLAKARERIESLEREVDLLKVQNAALKRSELNTAADTMDINGEGGGGAGYVLGTGTGNMDDARLQMHSKWEQDKRLQKRVGILEKRLAEKMSENEELILQVNKGRDNLHSALSAKEEMQKKAQASQKHATETRKVTADDVGELEQAHSKIFSLEEELVRLRRKAHVEQSNEISALGHQISVQRSRISELEAELAENEVRHKRNAANKGPRSLRESEDQYMREERLKDDLNLAKRQKLELEAALLDRDARAIESRFDLEASELEVVRLKRRVKELESAYKGLSSITQLGAPRGYTGTVSGMNTGGGGGPKGKKEEELEGALETMKRIVDKLKTENDRLKKGGSATDERKMIEIDRKYQSERKRADRIEEENKSMLEKLKGYEETSQKIVQRQQQVAMLRRQLKEKEDELIAFREQHEHAIIEKENLKKRITTMQERMTDLEMNLLKKPQGSAGSTNKGGSAITNTNVATVKVDNLQSEILELRNENAIHEQQNRTLKVQLDDLRKLGPSSNGTELLSDNRKLKDENSKLRKELSAFDLDFFEEIENLKYAHAEAIRKLRMYENSSDLSMGGNRGTNNNSSNSNNS